ncbi:MAG: uridine kinase [Clostridiales bacterium]|nr:uridine kinase [Clostridiales bacterium]
MTEEILRLADALLASRGRVIAAIDGRCASGKTALAGRLQSLAGCAVFHMDDFFLRPEQRTLKRLKTPGENVDHERFLSEALLPLRNGAEEISFRRFDCRTMRLGETETVRPGRFVIVEGSYSLNDALFPYYDMRIFLTVSPDEQLRRIAEREGEGGAEAFKNRWIPMEEAYFAACRPEKRCDLRFDTTGRILE